MIKYKMNIVEELRKKGYTTYKIKKEKLISDTTLQSLRDGKGITTKSINAICCMLRCKPEDILEFEMTDEEKIKYFM